MSLNRQLSRLPLKVLSNINRLDRQVWATSFGSRLGLQLTEADRFDMRRAEVTPRYYKVIT